MGSLYLQKKTLISFSRMWGRFCTMRLMLRSATYWISGSELSRVTRGGASLRVRARMASLRMLEGPPMSSMYDKITLTALITTAELACWRRGVTRSMMPSASRPSAGVYLARESRIKTCPHSVHSFRAASSFCRTAAETFMTSLPEASAISERAATALATTEGLLSEMRSWRVSKNPRSTTSSGAISYSFATQTAAVLRT
mmetsp:Transcript_16557/g.45614  ORF Transcript_16557/g.45614 Transcript_16557/m.45614 type:complete len:200 (-) Transcript_16557:679-1278(-)